MSNQDDGTVLIHGKSYLTTARRVKDFRHDHPGFSIITKVLSAADVVLVRAKILDETGRCLSTGYAEEVRGETNINKTSALENAETSAVGRCLSLYGYLGTTIAGAEEMEAALAQQEQINQVDAMIAHNAAVREHIGSIMAIKDYLLNGDYELAFEAISEIPEEDAKRLWRAPSKGGIWSTAERTAMKSDLWAAARKTHHGGGS